MRKVEKLLNDRLYHLITDYYRYIGYQHYADECRARMFEVCRIGYLAGCISGHEYETIVSVITMISTGEPMEDRL